MDKPRIFIGSSKEGLDVANAIHDNLDEFAEVTIWTQGVFKLSSVIITTLVNSLNKYDFAIFIFSPDDITNLRGIDYSTVRDNVIFETGLFIAKLGINRVFFLKPRDQTDIHLPSDLLGMIAGEYNSKRSDHNLVAATGPFCNQVRQQILEIKADNLEAASQTTKEELVNDYENDLKMIDVYLKEYGWTMISFEKLKENIHPKFSESYVMKIIEKYPLYIRRCKLQEGVYGIKILD